MSNSHPLDLTTCDREQIHVPGAIQPHGFLLALDPAAWTVLHASENLGRFLPRGAAEALLRPVDEMLEPAAVAALRQAADNPLSFERPIFVAFLRGAGTLQPAPAFALLAHQRGGRIIVEGEVIEGDAPELRPDTHYEMDALLARMEAATTVRPLLQLAVEETRRITGFDRVMIYQFDADWNGIVIAEDRNSVLPSYLDLRFPASDIPRQARELYRVNRLRLIARSAYEPVRVLAAGTDGAPLDLSLSTLRSVSPIHLEYMRNMGTGSSMSISLMRGGQLWGLVSCHSREARLVPFQVRATCELLGQVLSLQVATREQGAALAYRMQLNAVLVRLMSAMSRQQDVVAGLRGQTADLLALTESTGAAVIFHGRVELVGRTPHREQVLALAAWLEHHASGEVTAFDRLAEACPPAAGLAEVAGGLLAISLSRVHRNYVLWFRPEVIATVKWGGNPAKPADANDATRLHPRKSFEAWAETVRGQSLPWQAAEIDVARELRSGIIEIVLQHAERLAAISEELVSANQELETISYTISHDLRAPLRAMYGYADSLREDAAEKLSPTELERLERISRAAHRLDRMIRDVLRYGHVSRIEIDRQPVSLEEAVRRLVVSQPALQAHGADIRIAGPLPSVVGHPELVEQALLALLSNAVKFVAPGVTPVIDVRADRSGSRVRLWVEDNGIGIAREHHERIFGVFARMHPEPMFEGNGVGLAIAKRAIDRLGGAIGVESILGSGSRFWIELPTA